MDDNESSADEVSEQSEEESDKSDDVSDSDEKKEDPDVITIVADNDRITSSIITLAEITRAVGIRATQIDNGAQPYVDITGLNDVVKMALKEIYERKSPLTIRRFLSPNVAEDWAINEMELPRRYRDDNPL